MSTGLSVLSEPARARVRRVESRYDRAGGGSASPATAREEPSDLGAVSLVVRRLPLASFPAAVDGERSEVVEHCRRAPAERLEPLLRQPGVAAAGVDEGADCVPEADVGREAVAALDRPAGLRHRDRVARHGGRTGQVREQVDEVAPLAEQPSAPVLGIVEPVVVGERAGVDAHGEHQVADLSELRLQPLDERGEAAVEADHEHRVRRNGALDLFELLPGQGERLLDEDGLSRS